MLHANSQPAAFKHDYLKGGVASLVGQRVESPLHMGQLCQVYRHPKFETFHVVYTKSNEVVGHSAVTNRRIGYVKFSPTMDETASTIKDHMQNLGADGYWLVHNHPKGHAFASQGDIDTTKEIASKVPSMHGHVIVNHTKFVHLQPNGEYTSHEIDQSESYALLKHTVPHDVISRTISSLHDVQNITKQFHKSGNVVILGLDAKQGMMHVGSVASFPKHFLSARSSSDLNRGIARVVRFITQTGMNAKAVIGVSHASEIPEFLHLVASGLVHNVVSFDGQHARATTEFGSQYDARGDKRYVVYNVKKSIESSDPLKTDEGKQIIEQINSGTYKL